MNLPQRFLERMKAQLGGEYEEFLASFDRPAFRGLRRNPLKCEEAVLRKSLPFSLSPTPFSPLSFYGEAEERVGVLPAHHAGMFYSQEPSAASAVTVLAPQQGERVLDLCAAPGGKSTQIAGQMGGKGLLWANEIGKSRANILLSNVERLGVKNAVISSCHPQRLCEALQGFFDRVLVDAPCSGEGMFRRDPAAVTQWAPESAAACALRQRAILDCAALAVKEGGVLVYSTCTFAREENEGTVTAFLSAHPEFEPCPIEESFGRPALDDVPGRRIYPMDGGEGHFVAKFRRVGENSCTTGMFSSSLSRGEENMARELYESLFLGGCPSCLSRFGDKIYLLPEELPALSGLGVLRAGVELGEVKGKRMEPAHGLFMSSQKKSCRQALDFSPEAPALLAFLRGEEIDCEETGYTAVCVNGVITGFGKASGGRLKNRYPKGLRNYK